MQWYRQALTKALNKEIDWNSDTLKLTAHTSTYVPNLDTHAYVSDLTNEVATGGGYTSGGWTLSGVTGPTYTAANSWGVSRANSTTYLAGDKVRPATGNGCLYEAVTSGTTGASVPTFPTTVGQTVTDGSVTWVCIGNGWIGLFASDLTQASYTATQRYFVLSDRTPGTAATQPLIGLIDLGASTAGSGGPLNIAFSTQGLLGIAV